MLKMGWRTCSELAVRTARSVLWNSIQACFKRQAAEIEQAPDLGLQIVHHILVVHAQDLAGQNAGPNDRISST